MMAVSIAGVLVCAALLLLGRLMGSTIVIGLFASLAFGATAIATLGGLGGSSPLIYAMFVLMLLAITILRRNIVDDLSEVFRGHWVPWLVLAMVVYAVGGALILPSLFADHTTAFVRVSGLIAERPLGPVSGNFTQTAYFTLGALTFFAFCIFLLDDRRLLIIRRGFMVYATMLVILGVVDLTSKLIGLGDSLAPLRTASYLMRTEAAIGDFWRIAGGFSEASGFAATSVTCLAFVVTFWRATGSYLALILSVCLLGLLLLSTSSTAYVALAVLALALLVSMLHSFLVGRFSVRDIVLLVVAIAGITALFALYLGNERLFEPFVGLIDTMVFQKLDSASGAVRVYWNYKSLLAFSDTWGLGIGMGSSRSSSLIVSILSQFGIIGTIIFGCLFGFMLRGLGGLKLPRGSAETFAIASGVRAAAFGSLLTDSLSGDSANPDLIFFISLAVILSCREHLRSKFDPLDSRPPSSLVSHPSPPAAQANVV